MGKDLENSNDKMGNASSLIDDIAENYENDIDFHLISEVKLNYVNLLTIICNNDPGQIPKIIETGILTKIATSLLKFIPVQTNSFLILFRLTVIVSI